MSTATKPAAQQQQSSTDLLVGKSQADVLALLAAGKISLEQAQSFMTAAAADGSKKKEKKECECSRDQFRLQASPLDITIAGQPMVADVKEFSTGSFGWYGNGKLRLKLADGTLVTCQAGITLTVLNSKESQ